MKEIKAEHKKLIAILIGAMTLTAIVICSAFYIYNQQKAAPLQMQAAATSQPEPTKTDFGSATPPDFPTNIPIEKGAVVNQSYSLDYAGQKQLTIVFPSTKTIAANYTLYTSFLKTDGWTVSNKYESAAPSSLYATKGTDDINVTVSASTSGSQVSISVLKK